MKVDLLKNLIKEAVREAVREEMKLILSEPATLSKNNNTSESKVTKYENYKPTVSKPVKTGDPISDLLNETKYSMASGDYKSPAVDMRSMVDGGDYNEYAQSSYSQGPEPGLDLSQFDFIGKAGAIYKASQEKDKQRHGA